MPPASKIPTPTIAVASTGVPKPKYTANGLDSIVPIKPPIMATIRTGRYFMNPILVFE